MSQKKIKQALPNVSSSIEETLADVVSRRTGGSINIHGLEFQLLYAAWLAVTKLKAPTSDSIRLEGLEDIDLFSVGTSEYIQVKTSQNKFDANAFWTLGVLENFLEVYQKDPLSKFRFVHNSSFATGMMDVLVSKKDSKEGLEFWLHKLSSLSSVENVKKFFECISFEAVGVRKLETEIVKHFLQDYSVNLNSEQPFLRALFYNIFRWSEKRTTIGFRDIKLMVQEVRDSFSTFPVNPALQNNWISLVSFDEETAPGDIGYYDGKAAQPSDIAKGLNAKRETWEDEIAKSVSKFDVTVIRSSSGQGKSTLAWVAAINATRQNSSVYKLSHCTTYDDAAALADFIETRLLIGQLPFIVIDGLSQQTSHWFLFAERMRNRPVTIVITSREEDWVRYAGDSTGFEMNIVDIQLSLTEAKGIFYALQRTKKLSASITTWEPAWEQVGKKGLLIEYVYLLTQGQMIQDRLNLQIKILSKTPDSPVKIEILRLISLADVLNIRVRTQKLTDHVLSRFQLIGDRNEIYKELEKEYYLKFGTKHVEGLHPVRSSHLVDILHSNIDVNSSLAELLKVVDEEYIYDFFIAAPIQFQLDDDFFREAAKIVSDRSFSEMVYVMDGLMHADSFSYWLENKSIYNEASKRGGVEMGVSSTVPFGDSNYLEGLANSFGPEGQNVLDIAEILSKRTNFSFKKSFVYRFAKQLHHFLKFRVKTTSLEGLPFLYRWFTSIGIDFPDLVQINEASLMDILRTSEVQESSEVFGFYNFYKPDDYAAFVASNKEEIVALIKKKTNTLTIAEVSDEIHLNYLLDDGSRKINESSVYRINIVRTFFPNYKTYNTEAIILPFPNQAIMQAALQESIKHLEPEVLADEFKVHINQIWTKVIIDQYSSPSTYEWQKYHRAHRQNAVELARKCLRFIEAKLEMNVPRVVSLAKEFDQLATEYLRNNVMLPTFPPRSRRYFEKSIFAQQERDIDEFRGSFRNYLNQFSGLITPRNEKDLHLPFVNIKTAIGKIAAMQEAYEMMISGTHKYLSTDQVKRDEAAVFPKLMFSTSFYAHYLRSKRTDKIILASRAILEWAESEKRRVLNEIKSIVELASAETTYRFTMPLEIIESGVLTFATIGVEGSFLRQDDFMNVLLALKDLSASEIHFFNIAFADEDKNIISVFRVSIQGFETIKQALTGVDPGSNNTMPLSVDPGDATVSVPEGYKIREVKIKRPDETYFAMMIDIWRLSQYRSRLNLKNATELEWMREAEKEFEALIRANFAAIASNSPTNFDRAMLEKVVSGELTFTEDEIVSLMLEKLET